MQIRMTDDFTYPLDEAGSVERTLPRGYVFNEPDDIAQAAIDAGKAKPFDEDTAAAEGEMDKDAEDEPPADPPADPPPQPAKRRAGNA